MRKVSIIIPVYKVEPYIERCVRSVMVQTYADIECILVDDCSPDNSMAICERMITEYHGPIIFKILHHEHNRGLSAARNTGTDAAMGEYIFFLDSDDEITPNCISLLVQETRLHPEVELVQGGVKTIPYDSWFDLSYYQHPCFIDENAWIRYNFFKSGEELPVMAWNKLIRKDFLSSNNISFKEGLIHEDELWTLQLVKKLKKTAIIGDSTYIYYKTGASIMSTTSRQRSARNMLYICRVALRELDEPYKELQLYKYLCILFDRIEYIYKSNEAFLCTISAAAASFRCKHYKLALKMIKFICFSDTRKKANIQVYKHWERESQKNHS